jgi:pyridoxamine 5'-phosphate oxidase
VRVQGIVEQVSDLDADEYYKSRDRKSRIGAWVSQQSRPLESRASLLADIAKYGLKYAIGDIPRPQYWSGYRVKPLYLEFWRNGAFRLHDRLVFSRQSINDNWIKNTLQP